MTAGGRLTDPEAAVEAILSQVGKEIVLGLPLGLGKANHIANALYERAAADRSIDLRVFTALTLSRPKPSSDLERRFIEPVLDRTFGGYPELAWVAALKAGDLPPNVEINEFFFQAGMWTGSPVAQQSYISANYTHASRYILDRGVNVIAQLVGDDGRNLNLSCNTDLTLELLQARREGRADFLLAGQVNGELPLMPGEAEVAPKEFGLILDGPDVQFPLPGPPNEPVSLADHARGLHIASLIPDGGTLEIGIGSLSHAVCHALILRHTRSALFRELLGRLVPPDDRVTRHVEPFSEGLYGCTEMFVDGFLELWRAGVLKREVDGAVMHAAFFLGPRGFYAALRDLKSEDRAKFRMTSVGYVNELFGPDAENRRAGRRDARFVNNAMMATLLGAVVSDGLEDGRVISGVGGQYNFVAQAFALDGARSIVTLPAVRGAAKPASNIRYSYGHVTVPRHLRDMLVTEYGVADLLGASDGRVIERMLAVTDSRFQARLLKQAREAGKLALDFTIPAHATRNFPTSIETALADNRADLPAFPFGSDFNEDEELLMPVLAHLRDASRSPQQLVEFALRGLLSSYSDIDGPARKRLGLKGMKGFVQRVLIKGVANRQT